jgi:DNA invertase Pin-like site-specific DNA recombinase
MKATTLAFSYVRFSHPDQARGDSLRRQTELRDKWIARQSGVILDTSLTLEDKGVSAFAGEHRDNPDRHALAAFLDLVKAKRIPRGSYLVVENLDRLSREHVMAALSLVLELVNAGIKVVQLSPNEIILDEKSDTMAVVMTVMELSRGHGESQIKSERIGSVWQKKKRQAAEDKTPITSNAPAWLELVDGRWKVKESAAATIQSIFKMATEGFGLDKIVRKLNAEGTPPIGNGSFWARSYLARILASRTVIGEFQPFRGRGKKRQHDGKPVEGYFPAIVSQAEFDAARNSIAARREKRGRECKEYINIFAGLLHDAQNGGPLQMADKGKHGHRVLRSVRAKSGVNGTKNVSFPLGVFEREILARLREITPREILPSHDESADEVLALAGKLAASELEVERLKNRLLRQYSEGVADVLQRQETEGKRLAALLDKARQKAATPAAAAWKEYKSLAAVLETANDATEIRVKLRAVLRNIALGVWCVFMARDLIRIAAVQIHFHSGARRDYLILHRPATGGAVGDRPAQTWSQSLPLELVPRAFDLRDSKVVKVLTRKLETINIEMFMNKR